MPDGLHRAMDFIPYLSLSAASGDRRYHINMSDIAKTVIISVITGILSAQITIARLDERMKTLENEVRQFKSDFYRPAAPK